LLILLRQDSNFAIPPLLAQWSEEQRISALANAYWSEVMVEQLLLQQEYQSSEQEAEQLAQLQVALHKLERAKLEVAIYTDAIAKAARQWGISTGKTIFSVRQALDNDDTCSRWDISHWQYSQACTEAQYSSHCLE
jgi:hypothetical protein